MDGHQCEACVLRGCLDCESLSSCLECDEGDGYTLDDGRKVCVGSVSDAALPLVGVLGGLTFMALVGVVVYAAVGRKKGALNKNRSDLDIDSFATEDK